MSTAVRLDLNNIEFQSALFDLQKPEQLAVLATLRKIASVSWDQVHRDKGLHWEAIHSRSGPDGKRLYSLRITQRCRAVAMREGEYLRFLSIHPDHDSAYK
jgi:hypothetical protein